METTQILPPEPSDILPPGVYPSGPAYSGRKAHTIQISSKDRPKAYTHQWYDAMFDLWEFYRQSYEGGPEFLFKNLWRHPQERHVNYNRRLERAVHLNHVRVVVDTYSGHLYRKPFHRSLDNVAGPEAEMLEGFWLDVDRQGTASQQFFKKVFRRALFFGVQAVVVDRFDGQPQANPPQTLAEQQARGIRPYAYRVDPTDVVDWAQDEEGAFDWIVIREYKQPPRTFAEPFEKLEERFRVWTRTGWELYRVEAAEADENPDKKYRYVLEESGEHPCGQVPVVFCYVGEQVEQLPIAEPLVRDLAPLVRQLTNKLSLIDEQIYQHVFNILVAPEEVFESLQQTDWSSAGVLRWAGDDNKKPFYLAPSIDQLQAIRAEVRELEMAIRYLSGMGRQNEGQRVYISDTSLAFQTIDKRALLESLGRTMAETEREVSRLALLWQGLDPGEAPLPGFEIDLEPGEIEKTLTDGLRLIALGIPMDSEATLETMIQGARAHLGGRVDPVRMEGIVDDLRARWSSMSKNEPANMFTQIGA